MYAYYYIIYMYMTIFNILITIVHIFIFIQVFFGKKELETVKQFLILPNVQQYTCLLTKFILVELYFNKYQTIGFLAVSKQIVTAYIP